MNKLNYYLNEAIKSTSGNYVWFEEVTIEGFDSKSSIIKADKSSSKIGQALVSYFEKNKDLSKSDLTLSQSNLNSDVLSPAKRNRDDYSFTIIDTKTNRDFKVDVEYRDTGITNQKSNFLFIRINRTA